MWSRAGLPVRSPLLWNALPHQDTVDTIQQLCIGQSAHQKLELLQRLVMLLGYDSLAVFGDCFDEVGRRAPRGRAPRVAGPQTIQCTLHRCRPAHGLV